MGLAVDVAIRPERISIERRSVGGETETEGVNRVVGEIAVVEYLGADLHHWIRFPSGERVLATEKNMGHALDAVGTAVEVRFERNGCIVLPTAESDAAAPTSGVARVDERSAR